MRPEGFLMGSLLLGVVDCGFRERDLDVVAYLSRQMGVEFVSFLDDSGEAGLIKKARRVLGGDVYCGLLSSPVLEKHLENNVSQFRFFQARTAIVTREDLDFTGLFNKVQLPGYLVWMIFRSFRDYNGSLYVPVNCDVVFVDSTSEVITARQVYHLKPTAGETTGSLWSWRPGAEEKPPFALESKKNDFRNVSMDMIVINLRETCGDMRNLTTMRKIECIHQDLLGLIGERLNFRINVVECQEKLHPYSYPNGTESELFSKLRKGEVDFSVASHVITRRNFHRFDSLWPTFVLKSMMYIRPGRFSGRWALYLRPLQESVWWAIFAWILFTGVLIHIFEKALARSLNCSLSLAADLVVSTLKALQVFCNQALADIPPSNSVRILYIFTFFVVLIFFQAYCGYLASSLTVLVSRFPFTDLNGFFENGEYRVMTLRRGFHKYYFKKVIGQERKEDFMLGDDELPVTVQDAVEKLCGERFLAFTEFREDLLNIDKLKCKIAELPFPILQLYVSIASPRHSPYKEFTARELMHLRSTGILKRLGSRLAARSEFLDKHYQEDYAVVLLSQIFSIFILLGLGVLLSILVLVLEIFAKKWKKSSARSWKRGLKPFGGIRVNT